MTLKKARFQFLLQQVWRRLSSEMMSHVAWQILIDILEKLNVFIMNEIKIGEVEGTHEKYKVQVVFTFQRWTNYRGRKKNGCNFILTAMVLCIINTCSRLNWISSITEVSYDVSQKTSNEMSLEMAKWRMGLHHDNVSATWLCLSSALWLRVKWLWTSNFLCTVLLSP
jgi:hypothetical protein